MPLAIVTSEIEDRTLVYSCSGNLLSQKTPFKSTRTLGIDVLNYLNLEIRVCLVLISFFIHKAFSSILSLVL